jgi:hypothetical protein
MSLFSYLKTAYVSIAHKTTDKIIVIKVLPPNYRDPTTVKIIALYASRF